MFLLRMFRRRWLLTTVLVFAGTAVCIRLGIWQLDRLAQRRAFNAQYLAQRAAPALDLNQQVPESVAGMEWRAVKVTGEYDFANQIALRNQYNSSNEIGYHLLTPLRFDSSSRSGQAVILVDRGWIPADGNSTPEDWRKYDQPGTVALSGQLRLGQTKPAFGGTVDVLPQNGARLDTWYNADLARIAKQMPYPILPVYIQPQPKPHDAKPPIPYQPEVEISEGPHLGYAFQWFTFATILFVGYPFFLRKQEEGPK